MRSQRWVWVTVFIVGLVLIIGLTTGWNLIFVHDYQVMLESVEALKADPSKISPVWSIVFASLTLIAAVSALVVFFVRLLREMNLNQLQQDFLASVTHELRTPIATLELSSSLLKQEMKDPGLNELDVQRLWKSHDEELKRLKQEVEILLTATRITSKKITKANLETFNLETWLQSAQEHWQRRLGPQATLIRSGPPLDFNVSLEERSLRLIFDNIVDNARKYALDAPFLEVQTSVHLRGRLVSPLMTPHWKIEFKDHGYGFNGGDSKKLFHKFFRISSSDLEQERKKIPGVGLGLFIAKTSAEKLGLNLSAHSPGLRQGSRFTLSTRKSPSGFAQ